MHLWLCDSANPKHGQWTKRFGGFLIKHLGFFFFQKHWTIEHWHICVCAFCSSFRSFTSVCLLSLLMSRQKPTACSALLIKFTSGSLTGKTESELFSLEGFFETTLCFSGNCPLQGNFSIMQWHGLFLYCFSHFYVWEFIPVII